MKYIMYDDGTNWEMVYCDSGKVSDTDEDIIKAINGEYYVKKLWCYENENEGSLEVEDDSRLYITKDLDGQMFIWQIGCSNVTDMNDTVIPHLYRVRKVGVIV